MTSDPVTSAIVAGAEQAIEAEEEAVTRVAEATQALEKQIESTRMDLQQAGDHHCKWLFGRQHGW